MADLKNNIKLFKEILKKEGLKYTPQRENVLEIILNTKGHLDCEDLYALIKSKNIKVSRSTLYRTLDILVKHNMIRKLDLGDGVFRYEKKINVPHHDHMICINCSDIIEFVNDDIENIQIEIAESFKFKLIRHIHQLFGICENCQ